MSQILWDIEQGSDAWLQKRCGLVTASNLSKVLAKGEGTTRKNYLKKVAAERITGQPLPEQYTNANMERGKLLEADAQRLYERTHNVMVGNCGIIIHDTLLVAASPDGLIGDDGGEETKSVLATTHMDTVLSGGYPSEHKPQVQGNLWISEREWWDFCSYCPQMPEPEQLYVYRVYRDDVYIKMLEAETIRFLEDVEEYINKYKAKFLQMR